jgi:hypothetical protein
MYKDMQVCRAHKSPHYLKVVPCGERDSKITHSENREGAPKNVCTV